MTFNIGYENGPIFRHGKRHWDSDMTIGQWLRLTRIIKTIDVSSGRVSRKEPPLMVNCQTSDGVEWSSKLL